MKIVAIFLMALPFRQATGQSHVFVKAEDVLDTSLKTTGIVKLQFPWGNRGKNVVAHYNDGRKESFSKKSIWGVVLSGGEKLRFFKGNTYKVLSLKPIILYQSYSPHPIYYFSKNLHDEVKLLGLNEMSKTLTDDELVEAFKQLPIVRRWGY